MSFNRRVKIQLTANSPMMDIYTQGLMTLAMGEFLSASNPQPDDSLEFDFSYLDKDGVLHILNPHRFVRGAIRISKDHRPGQKEGE